MRDFYYLTINLEDLKKAIEFFFIIALIIITRFLDVFFTYKFIPDLKTEINPIVSISKFKWTGVITVQVIIILFVIYLIYQYLFNPITNFVPRNSGLSFDEFAYQMYQGKYIENKKWNPFISFPKGYIRSFHVLGWILPRVIIFSGIITTIMHLLLMYSPVYKNVHRYFIPFIYGVMMLAIFIMNYFFVYLKYNSYLRLSK